MREDENTLVRWLARTLPGGEAIGDDAALLDPEAWAVTVDQQLAGVHLPADVDPAVAARRLLAVNLSDLAAMGAEPGVAFVTLAAPPNFDHRRFFRALAATARRHDLRIVGGDLARQATFGASMTLLGRRGGSRWLERSGAQPGHRLWLGGVVGEAALGLALLRRGAHLKGRRVELPPVCEAPAGIAPAARRAVRRQLQPIAQLALGRWLATETTAGAAIDLSDGLARDLHRLCRASKVGAEIDVRALPYDRGTPRLAERLECDLRDQQLYGGEDYVLLFSLPPDVVPNATLKCHCIGTVRKGRRLFMVDGDSRTPLPDRGWDHVDT